MAFIATPDDHKLVEYLAQFYADPLGFVMAVYPWLKPDTILAEEEGPDKWQAEYLEELGKQVLRCDANLQEVVQMAVASGHGVGKFEAISTTVFTPFSSSKFGSLKPGDMVFGSDGRPVRILSTHPQGVKPIYRVAFDDGSHAMVGKDHLWAVRGRAQRRYGLKPFVVMSTGEIMDKGVKRPNGTTTAKQWEVPVQGAAEFDARQTELHPYLMGVWLGDGTVGQPQYSKPDLEVVDHLESLDYELRGRADGITKHIVDSRDEFASHEVFSCKSYERYIQDEYKYNSVEYRWELLRGLLDTDGECEKDGQVVYGTTSKRLADDIIWLTRSLGGKAMMQPAIKHAWYPDENGNRIQCRDCYRVTIRFAGTPLLFYIKRKQVRVRACEDRYAKRWIESIEYSHDEEAMCIRVDAEDGLYLTRDFIVTHNTSLAAWIIHWFLTTRPNAHAVATANTGAQLSDKTWRELAKWQQLAINGHHFEWTATSYKFIPSAKTQYAMGIPWSEHNSESFAGLHEEYVMTLYDESSGIPDIIWEVTAGSLTTKGALHLVFGNMTRASGRFHACFHKDRKRWTTFSVDSRTAKKANKKLLDEWVEDYGIESDFVRVRILGLPPNQATLQFIPTDIVMAALEREHKEELYRHAAKIMAVDVAREGDDSTVICCRHGLKLLWEKEYRGLNLMEVVQVVAELEDKEHPDAVFIDAVGIGAGVIDRGRQLGRAWIEHKGSHKSGLRECGNKRSECWYRMREWLENADLTVLPKDKQQVMIDDLTGIEYCFDRIDRTLMEKKIDMKRRGLASPDHGDALAMTFTQTVRPLRMIQEEYDYEEAERQRQRQSADNTKNSITGY